MTGEPPSGDDTASGAPARMQPALVGADEAELRLDRWFRRRFPHVSHGQLERWLRTGQVRIDGRRAKAGDRLAAGQQVRVPPAAHAAADAPARALARPVSEREGAELQARVLYKDEQLLVIDKPAGLAVQGGSKTARHLDGMLDALRFGGERPRLVHRLDKDTSGVLVLARTAAAAAELTAAFRSRSIGKLYWAVVVGVPEAGEGRIAQPLAKRLGPSGERVTADDDGQPAITEYRVVERAGRHAAWLALSPLTGRTHQLRAHCAALGTPILGDGKYGGGEAFLAEAGVGDGLHLHAREIRLPRPGRGELTVVAPLPPHMRATWRFFGFSKEAAGAGAPARTGRAVARPADRPGPRPRRRSSRRPGQA